MAKPKAGANEGSLYIVPDLESNLQDRLSRIEGHVRGIGAPILRPTLDTVQGDPLGKCFKVGLGEAWSRDEEPLGLHASWKRGNVRGLS